MLASRRGPFAGGERVLDLFAGTGALGLECLSRGAAHATFVERDRRALTALVANVDAVGGRGAARVWEGPVALALLGLTREARAFDLVVGDPPFAADAWGPVLAALVAGALLAPGAWVVAEHPPARPPPSVPPLCRATTRAFGAVAVTFFHRPARCVAGPGTGALGSGAGPP